MIKFFLFTLTITLAACGQPTIPQASSTGSKESEKKTPEKADITNALSFINGYVKFSDDPNSSHNTVDWVKLSSLTTKKFIADLEGILKEAYKEDPEMGLGFDPIFNAQDYPSDGFELGTYDEKTKTVLVKGVNMSEFTVTMKIRAENGKWLVDGCGIVNIPK